MKSGQIDVALAYFNRALEILPDFALSRYNRSVVYREKGLHSIAMNEALQARQLGFPVSDRYLSGLRMALEKGEGESVFLK